MTLYIAVESQQSHRGSELGLGAVHFALTRIYSETAVLGREVSQLPMPQEWVLSLYPTHSGARARPVLEMRLFRGKRTELSLLGETGSAMENGMLSALPTVVREIQASDVTSLLSLSLFLE